jgi:hypothetical protein
LWSFQTDPDFQKELGWIGHFIKTEVEPLDHVLGSQWDIHAPRFKALVRPLQARVPDGPTEVHKITVAQEVLKDYKPINQMFPSYVRYEQEERAREYFEAALND